MTDESIDNSVDSELDTPERLYFHVTAAKPSTRQIPDLHMLI